MTSFSFDIWLQTTPPTVAMIATIATTVATTILFAPPPADFWAAWIFAARALAAPRSGALAEFFAMVVSLLVV